MRRCPICKKNLIRKHEKICSDSEEYYILIDLKTGKKIEVAEFPMENPVKIREVFDKETETYEDIRKELPNSRTFMVFQKHNPEDDIWFTDSFYHSDFETKTDFTLKELKRICQLMKKMKSHTCGGNVAK